MLEYLASDSSLGFRFVLLVAFALIPLYLLTRVFHAESRSERRADLALFCGSSFLLIPELIYQPQTPEGKEWAVYFLGVRLVIALGAVVFSLWSIQLRRSDQGRGRWKSWAGLAGGLALLLVAGGFYLPSVIPTGSPSKSWVHFHREKNLRLVLPTRDWKEVPVEKGEEANLVKFANLTTKQNIRVQLKNEHENLESAKKLIGKLAEEAGSTQGKTLEETGRTRRGFEFAILTGITHSASKPAFLGRAALLLSDTQETLLVLSEGPLEGSVETFNKTQEEEMREAFTSFVKSINRTMGSTSAY